MFLRAANDTRPYHLGPLPMEALPRDASRADGDAPGPSLFLRRGAQWTIRYQLRDCVLPHLKGMNDLARLIEVPGREIHVLELVESADASPTPSLSMARSEGRVGRGPDGLSGLDATAIAAYRPRLQELRSERAEADRLGVIWSGLHRFWRELLARGAAPPEPADWNRVDPILECLASR